MPTTVQVIKEEEEEAEMVISAGEGAGVGATRVPMRTRQAFKSRGSGISGQLNPGTVERPPKDRCSAIIDHP
jgi:hypothetical protein